MWVEREGGRREGRGKRGRQVEEGRLRFALLVGWSALCLVCFKTAEASALLNGEKGSGESLGVETFREEVAAVCRCACGAGNLGKENPSSSVTGESRSY